jgi:hypothetical protein
VAQATEPGQLEEDFGDEGGYGWWVPGWWLFVVAGVLGALLGLGLWGWASDRDFPDVWNKAEASAGIGGDIANLTNPAVHEHADFAIFINGEQMDFNDARFVSGADHQHAHDVHIHEPRHTVVHKHKLKVTWGYFFETIGMEMTDTSFTDADGNTYENDGTNTLKFFVNGVQVDSLMNEQIHDLDRVLISYGPEAPDELGDQLAAVSNEACIPSERCADRIPADEPPEECSISNDTCVD